MAYTQADLLAIKEAITNGALIVKYSDKHITYRSLSELLKIEQIIASEVLGVSGFGRSYRKYYTLDSDLNRPAHYNVIPPVSGNAILGSEP